MENGIFIPHEEAKKNGRAEALPFSFEPLQ